MGPRAPHDLVQDFTQKSGIFPGSTMPMSIVKSYSTGSPVSRATAATGGGAGAGVTTQKCIFHPWCQVVPPFQVVTGPSFWYEHPFQPCT